jgi:hypothetical protein
MRIHLLFPLAFLSGVHGFIIFAPYLLAVVAMWHVNRARITLTQAKITPEPVLATRKLAFVRA